VIYSFQNLRFLKLNLYRYVEAESKARLATAAVAEQQRAQGLQAEAHRKIAIGESAAAAAVRRKAVTKAKKEAAEEAAMRQAVEELARTTNALTIAPENRGLSEEEVEPTKAADVNSLDFDAMISATSADVSQELEEGATTREEEEEEEEEFYDADTKPVIPGAVDEKEEVSDAFPAAPKKKAGGGKGLDISAPDAPAGESTKNFNDLRKSQDITAETASEVGL
jgi:hypothetical protein